MKLRFIFFIMIFSFFPLGATGNNTLVFRVHQSMDDNQHFQENHRAKIYVAREAEGYDCEGFRSLEKIIGCCGDCLVIPYILIKYGIWEGRFFSKKEE